MAKLIVKMQKGDDVVDGSVDRLAAKTKAKVVDVSKIDAVGKLKKGDTLILLAHGNRSKLGKYTPAEIADMLEKAGLQSGVTVDLVACNSGSGGSPLALELKTELVQKKIKPKSVSGGTDYMAVLNDGETATISKVGTRPDGKPQYAKKGKGTVKEDTPFGERTRNVDPEYRTT